MTLTLRRARLVTVVHLKKVDILSLLLFTDKYQEHAQINPESLHPHGNNLELHFCKAYLYQTTLHETVPCTLSFQQSISLSIKPHQNTER